MTPLRLLLRVGQAALVLLAAYTVSFAILRLLPGDAVTVMLASAGLDSNAVEPAQLAEMRHAAGLDRPVAIQFASGILEVLRGDFGVSYTTGGPVSELIAERSGGTLALAGLAAALSGLLGLALACAATLVPGRILRAILLRLPPLGVSLPSFWVGLLLVQLFSFTLGWLPASGSRTPATVVLPAVTLAIPYGAMIAQLLLRGLHEVYREDYVDTARMKGRGEFAVLLRHGLPNALAPALTMAALILGGLLTGTVVIETLFSRAGLGRLVQESVMNRDVPVVQAIVLLAAALFVAVNLLVDLLYPVLDARQRAGRSAAPRPELEPA